jgi:HSP20 family protein
MYSINRWDPFRDMMVMRRSMDRLLDSYFGESTDWNEPVTWGIALDVVENPDEFVVKASLPGVKPEDVDVTFSENTLTIKGETRHEEDREDERYHLRERRYGSFSRSLTLPRGIKGDAIEASYDSGVLTLRLPKTEEVKPQRIAIHSAESPRMIEGKSKDIASNKN